MNAPRRTLLAAALILALALPAASGGEAEDAELDILLSTIRANRKALVAVNLELTDAEAAKFWPLYDAYMKDMGALQDRVVGVIRDYSESFGSMTDDRAIELAKSYLAIENDRAKLRESKLEAFASALPGKKVARFYQIENKMDAVIRYDLAAGIPVIE